MVSQRLRTAYLKLCFAGLQQDMAQRIMYSALPFLADPAQVALTEGVVDTNALKAAVEGRKNIIKYGVRAVLKELAHYREHDERASNKGIRSKPYQTCNRAILNGEYVAAMDIAVTAFRETDSWYTNYGGKPWEMISRTIRQLARLDRQLDVVRARPRSHESDKEELQLMRDIVVEMNVFDGLAHNSDSILNNLAELETDAVAPSINSKERTKRHKENYVQLKRLMDAKELDSPVEVYKLLQDTLMGSGDIYKFKDWVTKMRNHKEYSSHDPKLAEKLLRIYLRKALIPSRGELNTSRDNLSTRLKDLESNWSVFELEGFLSYLNQYANYVMILAQEFEEHKNQFMEQYPELPTKEIVPIMDQLSAHAVGIANDLIDSWRTVDHKYKRLVEWSAEPQRFLPEKLDELKDEILQASKAGVSYLNKFSFLFDRI
jgi:hypothetical protein